ncbi:MAG TPA: hypothetical protein VJ723_07835, partial [Candidatus Angelobacter sp.]|nr:hypothetical protein [Candidatus Angelobacter sp.]
MLIFKIVEILMGATLLVLTFTKVFESPIGKVVVFSCALVLVICLIASEILKRRADKIRDE